jgi:3-hydroxymyristoyl/3-hydroxydecanoyl-(acyl carrier protein) dehydratase
MRWLFVDRIDTVKLGEKITGVKAVGFSEDFFVDHFPKMPVVPGVIVIESLAQLCGKLIELSVYEERGFWPFPILSMVNKAKFRRFIKPGSVIQMTGEVIGINPESAMVKVKAEVDGQTTTTAELMFVFDPKGSPNMLSEGEVERIERDYFKQIWPGYEDYLKTSRKAREGQG